MTFLVFGLHFFHLAGAACLAVFLVFLVLRLFQAIRWSWWWITAPLYPSFLFLVMWAAILVLCVLSLRNLH